MTPEHESLAPRAVLASAAALTLGLSACPLAAQTASVPEVQVGDEWQFVVYHAVPSTAPNRHWIVTSVRGDAIEATENGEPLHLTPELNVRESPRHHESEPKALSFPLEVGKRWRYTTDWLFKPKASKGRSVVDVEVVSFEVVTVPAGRFEAFKLVANASLHGTSPIGSRYEGIATTAYWYAPAARAVVRSVHHNPYLGSTTVELVAFRNER